MSLSEVVFISLICLNSSYMKGKGKGKIHPRASHEGPEME